MVAEDGNDLALYADDITLECAHTLITTVERNIQKYLDQVIEWMDDNNLLLADKMLAALFSPDPAEYNYELSLRIKEELIEITEHPHIFRQPFDTKLKLQRTCKII